MNDIYLHYAPMYEAMYKTFIDYEEEYRMYRDLLALPDEGNVVEFGCGTCHMYPFFRSAGYKYTGIDLNPTMLDIGRKKYRAADLKEGDMRHFILKKPVDGAFLMSRTLSYMITNEDLLAVFSALFKNLKPGGRLAFDVIDASVFLPDIESVLEVVHTAYDKGIRYQRVSRYSLDNSQCWAFRWVSDYYVSGPDGSDKHVTSDDSVVRAFTAQDVDLALRLCGFGDVMYFEKQAYAFPTLVFRAVRL